MGLIAKTRQPQRAVLMRFLGVGLANTAFGYGVYALLVLAGLPAQGALVVQFVLGALWNYHLHARLVFAVEGWGRLPAYVAAYVLIYALNAAGLAMVMDLGVGPLLAQLMILPFAVMLSWRLVGRVMGHRGGVSA
ncbi:GtrA family protein [Paracoccus sp. T5]|uniref:GtrA family protein n=1 Tax=Paracoccus sp. T5 TaxID=3402161 RepID=UPI003AED6479